MTLPNLHTAEEVAQAIGMSDRWVRRKVAQGAACTRLGHKLRFTDEQVAALLADHATERDVS